jgi:hypothetical protein
VATHLAKEKIGEPISQPSLHEKYFPMPIELTSQERDDAMHSLKKYFAEDMAEPLGDLRARLLLDYILTEIAPFAYNHGVHDA